MQSSKTSVFLATIFCMLFSGLAHGYVLFTQRWPSSTKVMVMYEQCGSANSTLMDGNTTWDAVAESAMADWNQNMNGMQFTGVRNSTIPIVSGDGKNSLFWNSNVFGNAFGSLTLAVTQRKWTGSTMTEADIVFNNTKPWNSYRGPQKTASSGGWLYDFRRVAIHEMGHVLGLDHPDLAGQNVVAIMNSITGNQDDIAADDAQGVQALYGSISPQASSISSPSNGSTLNATTATFSWNAVTLPNHYLLYMGTSPGANDMLGKDEGENLSDTVVLPVDGRMVYVRLYSLIHGSWYYNDYSYRTVDMRAVMSSPANGSQLSASPQFSWSGNANASKYILWVGNSSGTYDILAKDEQLNLSDTLALPTDGRTVYVRLFTVINSVYYYKDYTYTTPDTRAVMSSPANGAVFSGSSVAFNWNASSNATQYALWVGSSPGTYDLAAKNEGQSLSDTLTLPTAGHVVYVRLFSLISNAWFFRDYSYTTANTSGVMSSPANASVLGGSSVTFNWNAGTNATQYALWVGSNPGTYDLVARNEGQKLSDTVALPTDGRTVYVRLYSMINGAWGCNSYSYTTADTRAVMTSPTNGTVFSGSSVTLNWSRSANATQYALWVGSSPGTYDLVARSEGQNLSDTMTLPTDGRPLYVRLYSLINGAWCFNNYTYTAYSKPGGLLPAQLTTPTNGSVFGSSSVTLNWNTGNVGTQYALWVGSTPDSYDLLAEFEGSNLSKTITAPSDGRPIYVRLWSATAGGTWQQYNSYVFNSMDGRAKMTTPASGSTFASSSVSFAWSAGAATQYALWVGSAPGAYDLYADFQGTNLFKTLTLPTDGRPIYVQLWSMINGAWTSSASAYSAHF